MAHSNVSILDLVRLCAMVSRCRSLSLSFSLWFLMGRWRRIITSDTSSFSNWMMLLLLSMEFFVCCFVCAVCWEWVCLCTVYMGGYHEEESWKKGVISSLRSTAAVGSTGHYISRYDTNTPLQERCCLNNINYNVGNWLKYYLRWFIIKQRYARAHLATQNVVAFRKLISRDISACCSIGI